MKKSTSWKDYILHFSYSENGRNWIGLPISEFYKTKKELEAAIRDCYEAFMETAGGRSWQDEIIEPLDYRTNMLGINVLSFEVYVRQAGMLEGYYSIEAYVSM